MSQKEKKKPSAKQGNPEKKSTFDRQDFLQALKDDPEFARDTLQLLLPYLEAEFRAEKEIQAYAYTNGDGKEIIMVSAEFSTKMPETPRG